MHRTHCPSSSNDMLVFNASTTRTPLHAIGSLQRIFKKNSALGVAQCKDKGCCGYWLPIMDAAAKGFEAIERGDVAAAFVFF